MKKGILERGLVIALTATLLAGCGGSGNIGKDEESSAKSGKTSSADKEAGRNGSEGSGKEEGADSEAEGGTEAGDSLEQQLPFAAYDRDKEPTNTFESIVGADFYTSLAHYHSLTTSITVPELDNVKISFEEDEQQQKIRVDVTNEETGQVDIRFIMWSTNSPTSSATTQEYIGKQREELSRMNQENLVVENNTTVNVIPVGTMGSGTMEYVTFNGDFGIIRHRTGEDVVEIHRYRVCENVLLSMTVKCKEENLDIFLDIMRNFTIDEDKQLEESRW